MPFDAEKFRPPAHDPGRHLFREELIRRLLGQARNRQLVLIEAQEGQGKTTVAAQMVSRLNPLIVGWYSIDPEDSDPARFLAGIVACLTSAIPAFSCPALAELAAKGEISAHEFPACIDILRTDLARYLTRDCVLVFDDFHLLEESPLSRSILLSLIRFAPKRLHFIVTSQFPVLRGKETDIAHGSVLKLGNEDIRFAEKDVFVLCNDILHLALSRTEARELWTATEGWAMGLALILREMTGESPDGLAAQAIETRVPDALRKARAGSLNDFFRDQFFQLDDDTTRRILCELSLLSSIPLTLAEKLTGSGAVGALLKELAEKNHFIRSLNDAGTEFALHGLFRETLCLIAGEELSQAERQRIFVTAGDYHAAQKSPEDALSCYVQGMEYAAADRLLEREGLALCARNRLAFLESVLGPIPDDAKASYGWLSLLQGMMIMAKDPPASLTHLQRSLKIFSSQHNDYGRLYALAKLLYFHIHIDRKFNAALPLLEDLELLFSYMKKTLSDFDVMSIAHILSVAMSFIRGDFAFAERYSDLALSRDLDLKTENLLAEIYLARAWGFFFDVQRFNESIEACYPLSKSPSVSFLNRLLIGFCSIYLLAMEADFENFFHQEAQIEAAIENRLIAGTLSAPQLRLLKIHIAVAQGEHDKASALVRQGLHDSRAGLYAHYRSQYCQYQALLRAIAGDRAGAEESAQMALAQRLDAGGKSFATMNQMIVGSAYAVLGLRDKAEELLTRAIAGSKENGEDLFRAGAHASLAYLCLHQDRQEPAAAHAAECLRCLKNNGYHHFFGWTPAIMAPVLAYAVAHDIEAPFARMLAARHIGVALLPDGRAIPLLKISTLGHLSLSLEGRVVQSENLTPAMRELLALIISSPDMKMYQEEILASLWPDIPPAKARSRFDTLLLELRRILKAAFGDNGLLDHYLVLKRGMLCLLNCRLDADQFAELARKGLADARNREDWQAGNCFHSASLLWQGPYLAGIRGRDRINSRGYELERLCHNLSLTWARILSEAGRCGESIDVLNWAFGQDFTNDQIVGALYRAYLHNHQPIRANELLRQYEEALRAAEYEPDEIEDSLHAIWRGSGL